MATEAYNPSSSLQQKFLAAIRSTESGGNYSVGWGNTDLSGASAGAYGFPQWSGKPGPAGVSHAAGAYQFQPGTWAGIASKYNLDFRNKSDQDAGAWYLAQEDYTARTGRDLTADIEGGAWSKIASGLKSTWTSVTSSSLASGASAELSPGATPSEGTPSFFSDPLGATTTYFVRGAMIAVGIVILGVALWALLSRAGMVPASVKAG